MNRCENGVCNNPAEVKKVVGAPFSMTSTASSSQMVINICKSCAAADERLSKTSRPGFSILR